MANQKMIFGVVGVFVVGAAVRLYNAGRERSSAFIDPDDQMLVVQGKAIYANSCAACHG